MIMFIIVIVSPSMEIHLIKQWIKHFQYFKKIKLIIFYWNYESRYNFIGKLKLLILIGKSLSSFEKLGIKTFTIYILES